MRVHFHTFGCKANQYDTELVRQLLGDAGATAVGDPEDAEVVVINSCTVTHTGEAKMRRMVRQLARANPDIETVIMGCAAAVDDGRLADLPGVRAVVAGSDPVAVARALGVAEPVDPVMLRSFQRGARAWIKVQDGCDEHCTFCATTVARGASRSRAAAEIVAEARQLAAAHAEIVITGIHIGSYGKDLPAPGSLGKLLVRLVDEIPGVRFRLSSVEATELDPELEELMATAPANLAPHVHAPLQSGSDRVLKLMGRNWYDSRSYATRLERFAGRLGPFGLGADVMVGFPGETDEDHAATLRLVDRLPYTYLHVFPYSERDVAVARRIGPPVDPRVVAERSAELRARVAAKRDQYSRARSGTVADVVLTGRRFGVVEGLTGDYLPVQVEDTGGRQRLEAMLEWSEGKLAARPAVEVVA